MVEIRVAIPGGTKCAEHVRAGHKQKKCPMLSKIPEWHGWRCKMTGEPLKGVPYPDKCAACLEKMQEGREDGEKAKDPAGER